MNKFILTFLFLASSFALYSQQTPKTTELSAKDSPASKALNATAQDLVSNQKVFNVDFQQARSTFDSDQKNLSAQLTKDQQDLFDKLATDKKYSTEVDQINTIKKQLDQLRQSAEKKFAAETSSIQQKMQTDNTLIIKYFMPIVKAENNFSETATYSVETQKWSEPSTTKPVSDPVKK